MELTELQLYVIGLVASGLGVVLRFVAARFGLELGKVWMTIVVGVVAFGLALAFNIPELPACTDFWQCAQEYLALTTAYVGAATIIYNLLLDSILSRLGYTVERFLKA